MNPPLLTFYGDDFTGSTDVMEALTLGGVPTVLFLTPPAPQFVAERFPHVRALGFAGVSRSMSPAQMDAELPPIFSALAAFRAPLFHYKICSTFDSSPSVGSIGRATELGMRAFGAGVVPLVVGAPVLKRYVAFGNLFATIGEETYRLDRHPTMRQHPITPMHEADLRLHLAQQTDRRIGLIDMRHLATWEGLAALRSDGLGQGRAAEPIPAGQLRAAAPLAVRQSTADRGHAGLPALPSPARPAPQVQLRYLHRRLLAERPRWPVGHRGQPQRLSRPSAAR
jgi:uncharacterized protein YgbK (DUF1537 family)